MQLLLVSSVMGAPTALPKACSRLEWGWKQASVVCGLVVAPTSPQFGLSIGGGGASQNPWSLVVPSQATIADPPSVPMAVGSMATEAKICAAFGPSAPVSGVGASYPWKNRCRRALDAYAGLVRVCAAGSANPVTGPGLVGVPDVNAPSDFAQPPMTHAQRAQGLTAWAQLCTAPNYFALTPTQVSINVCPGLAGWWSVTIQACGFGSAPAFPPQGWDLTQGIRNAGVGAVANQPYGIFGPTVPFVSIASVPQPGPNFYQPSAATLNPLAFQFICNPAAPNDMNMPTGTSPSTGRTFRNSRCRRAADQFGRAAKQCRNKGSNDWFTTVADTLTTFLAPTVCNPATA